MQNILEVLPLPSGVKIAFFNLHGNTKMTKHCADELAKLLDGCEVLLTAESKGLQLTHCIADKLGQDFYAVARKSQKLYMQDGISVTISSSITTGREQRLYLSKHDAELLRGKKVGIVDDVVSTGNSLEGRLALPRFFRLPFSFRRQKVKNSVKTVRKQSSYFLSQLQKRFSFVFVQFVLAPGRDIEIKCGD